MRNRLRFRSDPAPFSLLHNKSSGTHAFEPDRALSNLAAALSSGGVPGGDLALDLVLHEIAEQVRIATGASGVAIALTRSGELVCRAATGTAPDLGIRLNSDSGLSGLCVQSKTLQRCDDAETDSRVDATACRSLKIRSMVMVPVIKKGKVIGLLEAFSASPGYFGQRDIETLQASCGRIVEMLDLSTDLLSQGSLPKGSEIPRSAALQASDTRTSRARRSTSWETWTIFLTFAVIATALLLGWMIGTGERRHVPTTPSAVASRPARPAATMKTSESAIATTNTLSAPSERQQTQKLPSTELNPSPHELPVGGLAVFQNGKLIYPETTRKAEPKKSADYGKPTIAHPANAASAIIPAGQTELLPPENADRYVIHRVQPAYPDAARKQNKQGAVLLKVLIGKDGGVQQVQAIAGDPLLAGAAADALVKWRFAPVFRLGQPVEFQTEITVNFKLP